MPRGYPLDLSNGTKTCNRCKETKTLSDFYKSTKMVSGLSVYCKACTGDGHRAWVAKNKPEVAAKMRKYRADHPDYFKHYDRKRLYNIDAETFTAMLDQQEHRCAICRADAPSKAGTFHVDHDHTTGKIRGLLCHNCNVGLGNFRSSKVFLTAAIEYLLRYS